MTFETHEQSERSSEHDRVRQDIPRQYTQLNAIFQFETLA